jgi:hypothetical protein
MKKIFKKITDKGFENIFKVTVSTYITNIEKIKKGDWYSYPDPNQYNNLVHKKYIDEKPEKNAQKIVLTSDQKLINDGVQFIGNENLKWLENNPDNDDFIVKFIVLPNSERGGYYEIIKPKIKFKTAVEYLIQHLKNLGMDFQLNSVNVIIEQAKEIEREQIINAYDSGTFFIEGNDYFENTFKNVGECDFNYYEIRAGKCQHAKIVHGKIFCLLKDC